MSLLKFHPMFTDDLFYPSKLASISYNENTSECEVINNDKEFRIALDVPGVKQQDLEVTVADGVIRILGTRHKLSSDGQTRKKIRFDRAFNVDPETVDLSKMTANLADGVLVVMAPKKPKQEPRKIMIQSLFATGTPHVESKEDKEEEKDTPKNGKTVQVETVQDQEQSKENDA